MAALVLFWGGFSPGCLVLRLKPPPMGWPPPPPPPGRDGATLGLYLLIALLLILLVLVGLVFRRAWRGHGECLPLDREDQALLRTARDALVYLIKRRMRRAGLALVGKR